MYHLFLKYSTEFFIMHEIGHALGLEHVPDRNSIMNPYFRVISLLPEPQAGDVAGIKSLYGRCTAFITISLPITQ